MSPRLFHSDVVELNQALTHQPQSRRKHTINLRQTSTTDDIGFRDSGIPGFRDSGISGVAIYYFIYNIH